MSGRLGKTYLAYYGDVFGASRRIHRKSGLPRRQKQMRWRGLVDAWGKWNNKNCVRTLVPVPGIERNNYDWPPALTWRILRQLNEPNLTPNRRSLHWARRAFLSGN